MNLSKEVTKALKTVGFLPDINGESTNNDASTSEAVAMDFQPGGGSSSKSGTESDNISQDGGPQPGPSGIQKETSGATSKEKAELFQAEAAYKKYMKNLQFDSSEFTLSGSQAHAHSAAFNRDGSPSSSVIIRVAQELSSLSASSPLDFSSAIFVRTDDDRATLMRFLITG